MDAQTVENYNDAMAQFLSAADRVGYRSIMTLPGGADVYYSLSEAAKAYGRDFVSFQWHSKDAILAARQLPSALDNRARRERQIVEDLLRGPA